MRQLNEYHYACNVESVLIFWLISKLKKRKVEVISPWIERGDLIEGGFGEAMFAGGI